MDNTLDWQFACAVIVPLLYLAIVSFLSKKPHNPCLVKDSNSASIVDMIKTPRGGRMADSALEDHYSSHSVLPRPGRTLQWQKLNAFVGNRRILKDVHGRADRGSVCAILGFSGAGKSVLLETLAARPTFKSQASYEITIDGQSVTDRRTYSTTVAYVAQHDTLTPLATVHEAIVFAAVLRNPGKNFKRCSLLANKLEREFRLERCKHSYIGGGYDGIRGVSMPVSGGERRRTSIAVELVIERGVVIIDEATSSLDSSSALECIVILAGLARAGATIITSLHQPSSGVFDLVDYVIIMKHGRVMHAGSRENLLSNFMERGYECPTQHNPADFALEVASKSTTDLEGDGFFLQSNESEIDLQMAAPTAELTMPDCQQRASASMQLGLLLKRDIQTYVRHRTSILVSFCVTAFIYILAGLVYYRVGTYDFAEYQRLQDNLGALTMLMVGPLSTVATPILLNFSEERPRFRREVAVQTYDIWPYVASKVIVQGVITFPEIDLAFVIGGTLTRLRGRLFTYIGVAWLLGLAVAATASLLGALAPDNKTAMSLFPLIFTPQYFFTGFFRPIKYLPSVLRWGQYSCALKYAMNLAVVEEFSATNCRKHSTKPDIAAANCQELQRLNNVESKHVYRDIATLVVISLGFRLLTALSLGARYGWKRASARKGATSRLLSHILPYFQKSDKLHEKKDENEVDGSDDAVSGLTDDKKLCMATEAVEVRYISDTA